MPSLSDKIKLKLIILHSYISAMRAAPSLQVGSRFKSYNCRTFFSQGREGTPTSSTCHVTKPTLVQNSLRPLIIFRGTRQVFIPERYQDIFSIIRLADYLSFELFLVMLLNISMCPVTVFQTLSMLGVSGKQWGTLTDTLYVERRGPPELDIGSVLFARRWWQIIMPGTIPPQFSPVVWEVA